MTACVPRAAALALVFLARALAAQNPTPPAGAASDAVRVYLDCQADCDFDYIRVETPWVAFVRERTAADVHVLITRLETGAGGSEYTVNMVGIGSYRAHNDTLRFVTRPQQPEAAVREAMVRTIQAGLVPYVMHTPRGARLQIRIDDDDDDATTRTVDRWNLWVFSIGAGAELDKEEEQDDLGINGDFSASRITPQLKFGFRAEGNLDRSRFHIDERVVTRRRESYGADVVAVRSLGGHWGAGAQAAVSSSTFENTRLAVRGAAGLEYSIWPYAEATRRQLVFQYALGVASFDYRERTIFGRTTETRPVHSFVVGYETRQPWGTADIQIENSQYLDDATKYRVEFDAGLEIQIVRGLSLDINGNASLIRDQLAIVARDATPEEILLEQRALRTNYRFDFEVGLSYTFGSIFNTVVNPRFGTGPGSLLRGNEGGNNRGNGR